MAYEGLFSDEIMVLYMPPLTYWVICGVYELIAYLRPDLRLHSEEEERLNTATRWDAVKNMLSQQAVLLSVFTLLAQVSKDDTGTPKPQPPFPVMVLQFFGAMALIDTAQYFTHRLLHANKFLYNHIHSVHHKIVVPFPIGSAYSHPLELIIGSIYSVAAVGLTQMTTRTAIYFYVFSNFRSVDSHCGLWLPWSPWNMLFGNNAAFHDIHHRLKSMRYNYSQPYFVSWDKILGTYLSFEVLERVEGGYEARTVMKQT